MKLNSPFVSTICIFLMSVSKVYYFLKGTCKTTVCLVPCALGFLTPIEMCFWEMILLTEQNVALHFHEGQRCCSHNCAIQTCERNSFSAQKLRARQSTKANWSENDQSKVFYAPEEGLDFSDIVKNASWRCYDHAGGCQVTAFIFGLCAQQISLKLVGF